MRIRQAWLQKVVAITSSRRFWWAIMALLVLQAAWIALSGKYPMAFDEDFHLGIIKLYAHHLSPFWSHQTEAADPFGAVARDPSYLYQYLMSFPYRLLTVFTHSQTLIVIIFRFVNIGFFAAGVVLFRRLLFRTRASAAIVNCCLLVLVLLPIVPLLAAQINYDNLLLPVIALALLQTLDLDAMLTRQKRLDSRAALKLLCLCLIASLIKYAFLPIFLALLLFLAVRYWRTRSKVKLSTLVGSWRQMSRPLQIGLVVLTLILSGLFVERFGINLLRYHTPVPDCSKVLSVEACSEYGPWIRDYNFRINKATSSHNPVTYTTDWLYGMWLRTFFAVGGPETNYETKGPLVVPSVAAIVFGMIGTLAFVLTFKRLFRRYDASVITLFLTVSAFYVGFLWLDEYAAWIRTGQPVAINGRYLIPIFPMLLVIMALAVAELTRFCRKLRVGFAAVIILCLLWGGGALTFILRSNDHWYWSNAAVRSANQVVRNALGPLTPGYNTPNQFLK